MLTGEGLMILLWTGRRLHTRCALVTGVHTCALPITILAPPTEWLWTIFTFRTEPWTASPGLAQSWSASSSSLVWSTAGYWWGRPDWDRLDRKSVVKGKCVSVRVVLGGRRIVTTNHHTAIQSIHNIHNTLQSPI